MSFDQLKKIAIVFNFPPVPVACKAYFEYTLK